MYKKDNTVNERTKIKNCEIKTVNKMIVLQIRRQNLLLNFELEFSYESGEF